MIDLNCREIFFGLNMVRQSSRLTKMIQIELVLPALTKEDRSPVTVADFAVQALVGKSLMDSFPADTLVGEEDSSSLLTDKAKQTLEKVTTYVSRVVPGASKKLVCKWIDHGKSHPGRRFWTLDPVDGTKGFLRGDQYVVALALIEDGVVQMGVLGCPVLMDDFQPDFSGAGCIVIAARGQGTWVFPVDGSAVPKPLRVSECHDPAQARILRSFESEHTNVDQIDAFAHFLGIQAKAVKMDSQAKYAVLAAGQGELLLRLLSPKQPDYREKIWDQAAGSLILGEAGGRITDLNGKPLDFTVGRMLVNNYGVLASNGHLHDTALEALKVITGNSSKPVHNNC